MPRAASVPTRTAKTARLYLRVSVEQKRLFEGASAASNQTITEFVVQSAEVAAREILADRTRFALAPEGVGGVLDRDRPRSTASRASCRDWPRS